MFVFCQIAPIGQLLGSGGTMRKLRYIETENVPYMVSGLLYTPSSFCCNNYVIIAIRIFTDCATV